MFIQIVFYVVDITFITLHLVYLYIDTNTHTHIHSPPEEEAVAQVKERLSQLFDAQSLGFVHEAPTAAPVCVNICIYTYTCTYILGPGRLWAAKQLRYPTEWAETLLAENNIASRRSRHTCLYQFTRRARLEKNGCGANASEHDLCSVRVIANALDPPNSSR